MSEISGDKHGLLLCLVRLATLCQLTGVLIPWLTVRRSVIK